MSERRKVECPVDEVTLLEDRARVVRRGTIELAAGLHSIAVEGVAPVLADKTLSARIPVGRVHDVRVVREPRLLPADRDEDIRELEAQMEALREAQQAVMQRITRIDTALALLETAGARTVAEIAEDASWSRDGADWDARIAEIEEREAALRFERIELGRKGIDHRRELLRLDRRRAVLIQPGTDRRAIVLVDLEVEEDVAIELEVEYVTPCACWRPYHRAELANDRVRFESDGCVWQNTGEDWDGVRLRFSTERPSLGAEPPRLVTDMLFVQKKTEGLRVERRAAAIENAGLGRGASSELPGIDDAGQALEIAAPSRASIPSDGRPHRVLLTSFESDAEVSLFCVPELTPAVLEKSVQTHRGKHPILAGPVDLVREGGIIGRTALLFVACGERFELGWGPDRALRVHREAEEIDRDTNLLKSWHSVTYRVRDRFSNLGGDLKKISVVERVPVSELEKVKIDVDPEHTSSGAAPDGDGMVRFTLDLAPFAQGTLELRYAVRRHADVSGI
jgi:uncharacterized protein (TIGR02231 family)